MSDAENVERFRAEVTPFIGREVQVYLWTHLDFPYLRAKLLRVGDEGIAVGKEVIPYEVVHSVGCDGVWVRVEPLRPEDLTYEDAT